MPSPRISIRPASSRRRPHHQLSPAGLQMDAVVADQHWPRAAGPARPARIRSNASRDLPAPDGPRISTARCADQHRGGVDARAAGVGHGAGSLTTKRAPATVGFAVGVGRTGAVLRPDPPAMGLDDLLGDRQPEPGILPKALMRPVGVEALEDPLQRIRRGSPGRRRRPRSRFPIARGGRRCAPCRRRSENDWALSSRLEITCPSREIVARHRESVGGAAAFEARRRRRRRCRAWFRWRPPPGR